jgi:hypothetical protein
MEVLMERRGRMTGAAGPIGVRSIARLAAVAATLAAAAVAAGCGGLAAPDLATGEVAGTVSGATGNARAYVLGAPQIQAAIHDGSFRLQGVPVGTARVVIFDGDARAELVAVEVKPAARSHVARDATAMPLAGRVVPVARPAGGASGTGARFTVEGTELSDVPAGAAGELFPLPPGQFSVQVALRGFKTSARSVTVGEAASIALELDLDLDDTAPLRGCLGAGCWPGLACNADDGRCYECARDADCGGTGICSPDHLCSNRAPGCGQPCDAASPCRSGLTCTGGFCLSLSGCVTWMQSFGSVCLVDDNGLVPTCSASIAQGQCWVPPGATGVAAEVGYCTAPCAKGDDCPTSYDCDATTHLCLR